VQPKLKVGLAHGERIAQCQHIKLIMDRSFPVQIDGGQPKATNLSFYLYLNEHCTFTLLG